MRILAPAKINLALDITGRRADGYHFVNMVMQSVNLFDEVTVKLKGSDIEVSCNDKSLPRNEKNTAVSAALHFLKETNIGRAGICIDIKKNIPSGAGLGGGSADAAAVLVALNRLFKTNLTQHELISIGAKVGADVPFCIAGGTKLAKGIGEELSDLPSLEGCYFVIVKPPVSVSTKEAYRAWDEKGIKNSRKIEDVVSALHKGDIELLGRSLFNVFEQVLEIKEVQQIKESMLALGANGALMSGSGSAVFGIFKSKISAQGAVKLLKNQYTDVFLCQPINCGAFIKNA